MKKVELFVMALAILLLVSPDLNAQRGFIDKLYYGFYFGGSKIGKDIGSLELEQRIGYNVSRDFCGVSSYRNVRKRLQRIYYEKL